MNHENVNEYIVMSLLMHLHSFSLESLLLDSLDQTCVMQQMFFFS